QANENRSPLMLPDDRVVADVRSALANSSDIKSTIDITAKDGVVTLKGKVTGLYEKQMAYSLTKGVLGVKDVNDQMDFEKVSPVVGGETTPTEAATTRPGKQVAQKSA